MGGVLTHRICLCLDSRWTAPIKCLVSYFLQTLASKDQSKLSEPIKELDIMLTQVIWPFELYNLSADFNSNCCSNF